jgi:transposase
MSKNQKSYFQTIEGNINTQQVIAAFDAFTSTYAAEYASHHKPCIIILDNASVHTSHAFLQRLDEWGSAGVVLPFLPPYRPELNLIDILWRKIKYEWLPLSCYLSYSHLKNAVISVLAGFGTEYQITFV